MKKKPVKPPPQRQRSRSQRHSSQPSRLTYDKLDDRWTLKEKQNLVAALKRFGTSDVQALQDVVRTKTVQQIELRMRKIRVSNYLRPHSFKSKDTPAPIELWEDMADDLVTLNKDYSLAIGQVLSMISYLEPFEPVAHQGEPNYPAIYRFLAALLRRETPPEISAVDASVLLDVLQNLADRLKMLDVSSQHQLMQLKYQLLELHSRKNSTLSIALGDPLALLSEKISAEAANATNETPAVTEADEPQPSTSTAREASDKAGKSDECAGTMQTTVRFNTGSEAKTVIIVSPASQTPIHVVLGEARNIATPEAGSSSEAKQPTPESVPESDDEEEETPAKATEQKTVQINIADLVSDAADADQGPHTGKLFSLNLFGIPVKYLNPRPEKGKRLHPTWPQPQEGRATPSKKRCRVKNRAKIKETKKS